MPRHDFYRAVLREFRASGIPFLVAGAYGLRHYARVYRDTKDLDLFVRGEDHRPAIRWFRRQGYDAKIVAGHWLGKIRHGPDFVDLIYRSRNGLCHVDDDWFRHAEPGRLFGVPVRYAPVEEMIWSKAFVMARDRFDGADIAHLLHARGGTLDWARLLRRFEEHMPVLLSHLMLFAFIYPNGRLCRGTLLSQSDYRHDVTKWGYADARLLPHGTLKKGQLNQ